ncbi:hypothetical protein KIW84_044193 [Lathyrus oleraceus]|uniref:Uncharacterized protein n=1 Tax=Pisum sativum TaxID=3888 RepID=A0A9D4XG10_PEA|nr:hypothetical protein KIW84_044193 [Pisum sativum]
MNVLPRVGTEPTSLVASSSLELFPSSNLLSRPVSLRRLKGWLEEEFPDSMLELRNFLTLPMKPEIRVGIDEASFLSPRFLRFGVVYTINSVREVIDVRLGFHPSRLLDGLIEIGQNEATPVEGICLPIGGLENKSIRKTTTETGTQRPPTVTSTPGKAEALLGLRTRKTYFKLAFDLEPNDLTDGLALPALMPIDRGPGPTSKESATSGTTPLEKRKERRNGKEYSTCIILNFS